MILMTALRILIIICTIICLSSRLAFECRGQGAGSFKWVAGKVVRPWWDSVAALLLLCLTFDVCFAGGTAAGGQLLVGQLLVGLLMFALLLICLTFDVILVGQLLLCCCYV